ncbi:hypothetical protein LPJ58_004355, partial [Coemansia sp. RSA 1591]
MSSVLVDAGQSDKVSLSDHTEETLGNSIMLDSDSSLDPSVNSSLGADTESLDVDSSNETLSLGSDATVSLKVGKGGQSGEWWEDSVEDSSDKLSLVSKVSSSLDVDTASLESEVASLVKLGKDGHGNEKWEDSGDVESSSVSLSLGSKVSSSLDSDVTLSLNVDRESLEVGKGGQSGEWWEDSGEVEVESSSEALPLGSDATVSLNSDVESLEVEESGHQGEKWEDSGEEESSSETLSLGTSVTSSLLDVGGGMVDDSDMGGMVDCEMGCDVDVLWKLPSVLLPESRLDDGSILSSELKSLLLAKLLSLTCSDGLTDSDGDHDWSL